MSLCRVKKDKENPYVILNKKFLEDETISLKLKGFLAYCLSKPDDWKFYVRQLATSLKEGKDAIYSIIDEGIRSGYIERSSQKFDGKFDKVEYTIRESKIKNFSTVSGNPDTESPDTESPTLLSNDNLPNIDKKEYRPSASPPPQASEIVSLLREAIQKTKPDIKMSSVQSYEKVVRLMLTTDNRSPEKIKRVIRWLPTSDFWSTVVLSANKFRENFDKLELGMSRAPSNGALNDLGLLNRLREYLDVHHRNDIILGADYVEFVNLRDAHYRAGEASFKDKVLNALRKVGVPVR